MNDRQKVIAKCYVYIQFIESTMYGGYDEMSKLLYKRLAQIAYRWEDEEIEHILKEFQEHFEG